jgi:hypothetical protein
LRFILAVSPAARFSAIQFTIFPRSRGVEAIPFLKSPLQVDVA